jgi:hypothetical protein
MNIISALITAAAFILPIASAQAFEPIDAAIPVNPFTVGFGLVSPPFNNATVSPPRCARKLQAIVYQPPSAARDYLNMIIRDFLVGLAELGYGPGSLEAIPIIKTFANRYQVTLQIQPVFSDVQNVVVAPGQNPTTGPRLFGALIAPTYLSQDGFVFDQVAGTYSLAKFAISSSAQGATIIVSVDVNSRSFFPC